MRILIPVLIFCAACGGDDGVDIDGDEELITTVELVFTPVGGGAQRVFAANDPDGDGGEPPTVDSVSLIAGEYELALSFENRLEDPPEDITAEVRDESDQHQIFFTNPESAGGGLWEPQSYLDMDANGLPIGLRNRVVLMGIESDFTVTLRHLPELNGTPQKTAGLAEAVDAMGFSGLGGGTDAQVTFPLSVGVP